jgi:putative ABC transport system ATP-binding protein
MAHGLRPRYNGYSTLLLDARLRTLPNRALNRPEIASVEFTPKPVPLLEAVHISRSDGPERTSLLRDVSLAVQAGDRLGLAGPSGAGKTVLLRALSRLDPVNEGEILWQGGAVHGSQVPTFRTRVMYLHQRPVLVEGSVEHNLRLPFSLHEHRNQQFDRTQVVAWLQELGRDEDFLGKQNQDLSGGESQLAGLLRALELDPQILLLDEPTAALDQYATGLVEKLVNDWIDHQPADRAFVWVSHNTEQTERMCGRVVQMAKGALVVSR